MGKNNKFIKKIMNIFAHGTDVEVGNLIDSLTSEELDLCNLYLKKCYLCKKRTSDLQLSEDGAICTSCKIDVEFFNDFLPFS